MNATIFDIQRSSFVDGPGIRTTVFFKGCNLRCRWCHNPESRQSAPQLLFYRDKCTGCGTCRRVCPHELQSCTLCGACALHCPADARQLCGRLYTVEEVVDEVVKDTAFYRNSGGGVTFSGGECLLQTDFLVEALTRCRAAGIHTAVDTAGCVPWEVFERVRPLTDLFLYDVKAYTESLHRDGTGVSNRLILENLQKLSGRAAIWVRVPVIGGFNDRLEEMQAIADFLRPLAVERVELLPYHAMGKHKYAAMGATAESFTVPSDEQMAAFRALF